MNLKRILVFVLTVLGGMSCGPSSGPDDRPDRVTGPLGVVKRHVEAFNAHDVRTMAELVSGDVQLFRFAGDSLVVDVAGREALRSSMEDYFIAVPDVHSRIEASTVAGRFVSIRERASWADSDGSRSAVSLGVYEVIDGRIHRVWYFPPIEASSR